MAERRLKELINSILDETTQDGFNQSDRHITDTLITFNGIDDILYDWYVNQYHYTTNKTRQNPKGKARGSARAAVNKDWGQLKPQRRGAYNSYVKAASKAVVANGYGVQLPGNPNQYVWRFYSWNNHTKENDDFVFLYYDGNIPTSSKENWEEYSKKLEKLSNLKTFQHWQ